MFRLLLIPVTLFLIFLIWWKFQKRKVMSLPAVSSATTLEKEPIPHILETHATVATTPLEDLKNVHELVSRFTLKNRHLNTLHYSTNADLCEHLLQGGNLLGNDHPSLKKNDEGRNVLIDRWGSPYHLHPLSGRLMEIRSAGPDLQIYTQDDLVWPKP